MWGKLKKKGIYSGLEMELIFHLQELFQSCIAMQEVGNFFWSCELRLIPGTPGLGVWGRRRGLSKAKRLSHVQTRNPIHSELSLG